MKISTPSQARGRIKEIVRNAIAEAGVSGPLRYTGPEDALAKSLGICITESVEMDDEGRYIPIAPPLSTRPNIIVNPTSGDIERLSFTYFHELTHHLIREDEELFSFLNEYATSATEFEHVVEHYCNIGAAEFIVPSEAVSDCIRSNGFGVGLIEALDRRYVASKPAIAIQLAHCAQHACFVVVCETGNPNRRVTRTDPIWTLTADGKQSLYVSLASKSYSPRIERYTISKYARIPTNHVISASYQGKCKVKGTARLPFQGETVWEVDCEAMYLKSKVYAVFNVAQPISPDQLPLL